MLTDVSRRGSGGHSSDKARSDVRKPGQPLGDFPVLYLFTGAPMMYSRSGAGRQRYPKEGMQQFDRQKFKALIHYVISRCPPDSVGRTKLNKTGFYADMLSYLQLGRPMTFETYVKQSHGPTATHLQSCLRELISEGAIEEHLVSYFNFSKFQYVSKYEPDLSRFTAPEKELVDEVSDFVCLHHTARSISEFSHTDAWQSARHGEELPYFAATELLAEGDVEESDIAWADQELSRLDNPRPQYREVRGKSLRSVCSELLEAQSRLRQ